MSSQDPSVMAHAAPSAEDPALASGKIRSMLKKMLTNGIAGPIRFLLSLRVGSGTGLAPMDGQDGAIIANGALAKLVMGDQLNPNANQYALWNYADPTLNLNSWRSLGHIQINTAVLATVMKNSVRVGTGTGLTTLDGGDGTIVASGAGAIVAVGDKTLASGATYAGMLLDNGVFYLWSSVSAGWFTHRPATLANTLKNSLRVGSGTHTTFDGTDGALVADGAHAAFVTYDVLGGANALAINRNATQFFIQTTDGALWAVSCTTGIITQDARTALTPGTSITLGVSGFPTPGSRVIKPTGDVDALIHLTASGAIAAGAVIATLASGHRPPGTVGAKGSKFTGGVLTAAADANLLINNAGQIVTETAFASTDTLICSARFQTT